MSLDVYKASAGSGKTFTLTQKYLSLLKGKTHKHILAVTFTNKATAEMKDRIIETLSKIVDGTEKKEENEANFKPDEAKQSLANLLHDYSHFNVSTIDGFYQQVMRSFVRELGLYGGYTLVLDQTEVIAKAVEELTFSLQEDQYKHLYQWLLDRAKEKIRAGESWKFQGELSLLAMQLFREDVAESLAMLRQQEDVQIRITSFRNSIKAKKKAILKEVNDKIDALKAVFARVGYEYQVKSNSSSGILMQLDSKVRKDAWPDFSATLLKAMDADEGVPHAVFSKSYLKENSALIAQLDEAGFVDAMQQLGTLLKQHKPTYESINVMLKPLDLLPVMLELEQFIHRYLKENNMVMLSQVNSFLHDMIGQCDTPFIYEKMGNYLNHYMLDEFQDTSILQWSNFKPLIAESLSRQKKNLIVGDIKQSIYRWRNSDWRILAGIDGDFQPQFKVNHFPKPANPDEDKIPPTINWRSYKEIVTFNNTFFTQLPPFFSAVEGKDVLINSYQDVQQEVAPKHADKEGLVQIKWVDAQVADKAEDYDNWVREQLLETLAQVIEKGFSYRDVAVLVEKNSEGSQVASWLLERAIPVISSESLLLSQSPAIRLLVAVIRMSCSLQPEMDARLLGMIRNVSDEENKALASAMQLPLFEAIERYIQIFKLNESDDNSAYLQAFQDVVASFADSSYPDAQTFIQWWDRKGCETKLPANDQLDAVQIVTIHRSKGLAYPIVMMPFCANDIYSKGGFVSKLLWCKTDNTAFTDLPVVPVEYKQALAESCFSAAYDEERLYETIDFVNKWYVGFTRAEKAMYIFSRKDKKANNAKQSTVLYSIAKEIHKGLSGEGIKAQWVENLQGSELFTIGSLHLKKEYMDPKSDEKDSKLADEKKQVIQTVSLPYYSMNFQGSRLQKRLTIQSSEQQRLGNTLHQLLQYIQTPNDVEKALAKTIRMGMLLPDQVEGARAEVEKVLAHPQAKTWFDGSYSAVWNERSIITHAHEKRKTNAMYRPDRLLVKDDTITVVDYKFGDEHDSYQKQIKNYMHLLKDMGRWRKIEGYLYYHKTGRVESVSI